MQGKSLFDFPIHLGLGASAVSEPQFTGFEWYNDYEKRHGDDLDEGRIVAMYRFDEPWTSWEVHPEGEEVVCCIQGRMTLHQELSDGTGQSHDLGPGDYAHGTRPMPTGLWSPCSSPRGRGLRTARGDRFRPGI